MTGPRLTFVLGIALLLLTPGPVRAQQEELAPLPEPGEAIEEGLTDPNEFFSDDGLNRDDLSNEDGDFDEPLPPLDEELWWHGGSYLYEPEGDKLGWPPPDCDQHYQVLRLPEWWHAPQPLTAFQEFLGADPIHPRPGMQWFGHQGFQWEPRFVGYGSYELFAMAFEEGDRRQDGIGHQLILDLDLRLTGTERFHVQFRPLGRKNSGGSFWQLNDPAGYDDNSTLIPDSYWFEGELYSIFGGLFGNPYPPRDYHFVAGKFPFLMQNALLMNDEILGVAINKNTILIPPFSNLNVQAYFAADDVDNQQTPSPHVFGINLTADFRRALIEVNYADLHDSPDSARARYAAGSVTQFFGAWTLAGRVLSKWANEAVGNDAQLYVFESNFTRSFGHHVHHCTGVEYGVFFANAFKATSGWSSISGGNFNRLRSAFEINPLVTISLGEQIEDTYGATLGVQLFRHHEDESIIPEVSYEEPGGTSLWGVSLRYLRKTGPRTYLEARGLKTWSDDKQREREGVFVSTFVLF